MAYKAKNCPKCGNIYIETGHKLCPDCYKEFQSKALEVCSFMRDNPNATTKEVMEAMKVDISTIRRMAREGYFEQETVSYPCKKCGAPIFKGTLCAKCLNKIQKNLKISMNAIDARKKLMAFENAQTTYKTFDKRK